MYLDIFLLRLSNFQEKFIVNQKKLSLNCIKINIFYFKSLTKKMLQKI